MKEKTCCFTGHRNILVEKCDIIENRTKNAIISLIKEGYTNFMAGGALGFDTIAALCVIELKNIYPHIKLNLALPCKDQDKSWNLKDKTVYDNIIKNADSVYYVSENYTRGCMHVRNTYMVNNSNFCICYLTEASGGTAYTVNLAYKKGLGVINVALLNSLENLQIKKYLKL